jgi:hypothetical protein
MACEGRLDQRQPSHTKGKSAQEAQKQVRPQKLQNAIHLWPLFRAANAKAGASKQQTLKRFKQTQD